MRFGCFLLSMILVLIGSQSTHALSAKELHQICKPLYLRNFEHQNTSDKLADLEASSEDLLCLSVVKVIIDFSGQLCFQAFHDKMKNSNVKNLKDYMTARDLNLEQSVTDFISLYTPEMGDAPAHMQVLRGVNHAATYNQCLVLE